MRYHLTFDKPAPPEYLELMLCRLYHCTPVELEEIPIETILAHLICITEEQKYQKTHSNG